MTEYKLLTDSAEHLKLILKNVQIMRKYLVTQPKLTQVTCQVTVWR